MRKKLITTRRSQITNKTNKNHRNFYEKLIEWLLFMTICCTFIAKKTTSPPIDKNTLSNIINISSKLLATWLRSPRLCSRINWSSVVKRNESTTSWNIVIPGATNCIPSFQPTNEINIYLLLFYLLLHLLKFYWSTFLPFFSAFLLLLHLFPAIVFWFSI